MALTEQRTLNRVEWLPGGKLRKYELVEILRDGESINQSIDSCEIDDPAEVAEVVGEAIAALQAERDQLAIQIAQLQSHQATGPQGE